MNRISFQYIEKEVVAGLKFPTEEVLPDDRQQSERSMELLRALSLGNLHHSKIRIFFEDDSSQKVVETTVWGVTDKRVILKQGMVIPIHRIYYVSV